MSEYIDREAAIQALRSQFAETALPRVYPGFNNCISMFLAEVPAADVVKVGRCRDCEHFETDHWEVVNYLPMIVAHEVCTRWGKGCKTSEDGYCFLWEAKKGQANGNDGS